MKGINGTVAIRNSEFRFWVQDLVFISFIEQNIRTVDETENDMKIVQHFVNDLSLALFAESFSPDGAGW